MRRKRIYHLRRDPSKVSRNLRSLVEQRGSFSDDGSAEQVDNSIGGRFTAWDGYIFGTTLELTPNRRIVQTWRTSEFPEDVPDSRVEILFEEIYDGTKVTLTHSNMPDNQVESYRQGWDDFYFKPMNTYFSK